jgi:hypothetical protein
MLQHHRPVHTFSPGPGLLWRQSLLLQHVEEYRLLDELRHHYRGRGFGCVYCDFGGREGHEGGGLEDSEPAVGHCCGSTACCHDFGGMYIGS